MPKKLAITISGAVPLGSYEAGVLYEILTALKAHNTHPDTLANPARRIEIDVLTGASAGGMTAAIASQVLLGINTSKFEAYDNPFYNAWVKRVDLKCLAAMHPGEDSMKSLFSSDEISDIASEFIAANTPAGPRHPAAGKNLLLGLALTNLKGFDYNAQTLNGAEFLYTRYQDSLRRDVGDAKTPPDWDEIRQAAVACGAFPIAFRIRELDRLAGDYLPGNILGPVAGNPVSPGGNSETLTFPYTDGGVFDNQPLGMARDLASTIDSYAENESRFYLFVSPWAKASSISTKPLDATNADFIKTTESLVLAVLNQARFKDWVMAEKINEDLDLLNQRAGELASLLLNGGIDAVQLLQTSQVLAEIFTKNAGTNLQAEQQRLRDQFSSLGKGLLDDPAKTALADAWIDSLLVLEYSAKLQDKCEMVIYAITAKDEDFAGTKLGSFAGFFQENFRLHDYEVGRRDAIEWLTSKNPADSPAPPASKYADIFPIRYQPDSSTAPNPDATLNNLPLAKMEPGPRNLFRDLITSRTEKLLAQHLQYPVLGPPARLLVNHIIKGKLDKLLELDE